MVSLGSYIKIFDNSGAKVVKCWNLILKKTFLGVNIGVGEIVQGSVKKHLPNRKIKKKNIVKLLIVTSRLNYKFLDGRVLKYKETRGVLLNNKFLPIATRVKTPISSILKDRKKNRWIRLRSISKGFV